MSTDNKCLELFEDAFNSKNISLFVDKLAKEGNQNIAKELERRQKRKSNNISSSSDNDNNNRRAINRRREESSVAEKENDGNDNGAVSNCSRGGSCSSCPCHQQLQNEKKRSSSSSSSSAGDDMEVEPPSSPSSSSSPASSSTPPAQLPPVTREAQLRQLRELCAKYKIESLVDDPKHVTQCPLCSSRCTELFKCDKCGKEGCSYLCIHEARGNDDDDKFAPRSFGSTPPTIEEAMTPQEALLGGDSLESIEQLFDMSDIDREKHLTPFRFLYFISEVLFNGALSEAQLVPCVHDDLKCLGRQFSRSVENS